ncbi:YlxR family protein [Microbacterium sp.]|uniref:YlxR family protein n=1 Tax=Microbacterium TaxID=33882 RepID=UPI000A92762A|nr:YlxR family protein [uncultured Microbacterium sp.]
MVERDGVLVADEKAVLPGRGAWVHDTDACVDAAIRRRAFGRALRVSGPLDTQTFQNTHQRNG